VGIARFDMQFFPNPGYIAENVSFSRNSDIGTPPLARIKKLTCRASWFAILSLAHRIDRMDLNGLDVSIPDHVPPPIHKHPGGKIATTVTDLFASGAVLTIAPKQKGSPPERFDFPQLHLSSLARDKAIGLHVTTLNSHLVGRAEVVGSVGPLRLNDLNGTNLAGAFRLTNLDLASYKVVAGLVSAEGRFQGTLGRTEVAGHAVIPDFEVTRSHHSQRLTAEYRLLVNGIRGDVTINSVTAHFLNSTLVGHGSITGRQGKTTVLDIDTHPAPIQDLLRLFVRSDPAPLDGSLSMHAHIVMPPGHETFLKRVQIDGNFRIANGIFTRKETQQKVDELSARARGLKDHVPPGQVVSDVRSSVRLRNEVAKLSDAFFAVPGAIAIGGGTYNLADEAIDLRGKLAMQASLSKAATGVKSILAIPLDPFFKKGHAGAVLPVRMTGTYSHPAFKMSL
jgi:hypothetical protein